MDRLKWHLNLILVILVFIAAACSFTSATFGGAFMATQQDGGFPTTTYVPHDTFYAILQIENAPDDTTTKVIWYSGTGDTKEKIAEERKIGGGTIPYAQSNPEGWQPGKYSAEIFMNDKLQRTLEFEVLES